jgi:hypothetical protein
VNNFFVCELRMMSFGKKMLLPMYRIEFVGKDILLQLNISHG